MKHAFFLSLCLLAACSVGGGDGWVSSGGELLKDTQNPWWVKSTARVSYCVNVDEATFSAPPARVRALVAQAIAYWKRELARPLPYLEEGNWNAMGVGTQTFEERACDGGEDLRLQFGYGTLSEEQRKSLRSGARLVAATIRTDYDDVDLRGRGFVYVASDRGEHAYPGDATTIEQAWRYDGLLYSVLVHELGHVFGIPHVGEQFSVMSQPFPDLILNRRGGSIMCQELRIARDYPAFFLPATENEYCFGSAARAAGARKFFGGDERAECVRLDTHAAAKTIDVRVGGSPVGRIENLTWTPYRHPAILLRLNPRQRVFPYPTTTSFNLLTGPSFYTFVGTGRYGTADVYVNLSSQFDSGTHVAGAAGMILDHLYPAPPARTPSDAFACPPDAT